MTTQHALLTLAGKDRPGIVAAISRVLYETGCNIEDSSMTRLRGQFTMMLMLRPPTQVRCAELEARLAATARAMELTYSVRDLPSEEEGAGAG
ncbi:MAG: amino acid-binding protein, partial [Magnetococcales bacterium]|nr:amino acid-binding protein [Magnetococcales bacterium]